MKLRYSEAFYSVQGLLDAGTKKEFFDNIKLQQEFASR